MHSAYNIWDVRVILKKSAIININRLWYISCVKLNSRPESRGGGTANRRRLLLCWIAEGLKINDIPPISPRRAVRSVQVCNPRRPLITSSFTLTGAPYVCPRHYTHLRGGVLLHIFLRALHRDAGYLLQVRPPVEERSRAPVLATRESLISLFYLRVCRNLMSDAACVLFRESSHLRSFERAWKIKIHHSWESTPTIENLL